VSGNDDDDVIPVQVWTTAPPGLVSVTVRVTPPSASLGHVTLDRLSEMGFVPETATAVVELKVTGAPFD
jgi:Fe2+ transport system protein FeoA